MATKNQGCWFAPDGAVASRADRCLDHLATHGLRREIAHGSPAPHQGLETPRTLQHGRVSD